MAAITSFDSTKESLIGILKSIGEGKTQLPDFQRGWIWDDDHIRSLLASVSLSYPIGAVMMLETGNVETRFKPRLIEGVTVRENPEPQRLILDGQQRLTSLYQALMLGRPVTTRDARGREIKRWYYLDIAKALSENGDREEAIVALPENRCLRNFRGEVTADYSTIESECTAELLPLRYIADTTELMTWQLKYFQTGDPTKMEWRIKRWTTLLEDVLQPLQRYDVPLIFLRKGTPKEAICQVFEKVNTGGVSLTVFELLTATYAADDFNLRDDWQAREKQIHKRKVLGMVSNTDFLQAVTLLSTWSRRADGTGGAVYCRRKDILRLQLDEYKRWASPVVEGFEQAAKFLHSQKVFDPRDLPYNTQLVPLAAILTALGDLAHTDGVRRKLSQWYWCGVFGELYGSAVESRFALDLTQVLDWIDGGPEPATVRDASFVPNRLLTLRTRNSAAYKGLSAILMREGCQDFRSGSSIDETLYFDERVDIHHLFPRDYCKKAGIEAARRESVVNKTPLSAKTHRTIGWNRPSIYLNALQRRDKLSPARVDQILFTHLIDPTLFRSDDFDAFFEARKSALLQRVAIAMGKPIREESEQLDLSVLSSEELHLDDEYEDDSPPVN